VIIEEFSLNPEPRTGEQRKAAETSEYSPCRAKDRPGWVRPLQNGQKEKCNARKERAHQKRGESPIPQEWIPKMNGTIPTLAHPRGTPKSLSSQLSEGLAGFILFSKVADKKTRIHTTPFGNETVWQDLRRPAQRPTGI